VSSTPIRLLHVTDPHLYAQRDATMRGVNTFESFQAVLQHVAANERQPTAIIATGDLVQDETRQGYERFCKLVGESGVPVHCIPGNHDAPPIMSELLSNAPFHYCGDARYAGWQLIMLDTTARWHESGQMHAEELQRLDRTLAANPGQHALLCMHHHPTPMGSAWLDRINLLNSDEFLAVVERHNNVRGIVWGHVHQESDRELNGIRMLSSPSTCSQFLPNSETFHLDTTPPGYRWIDLMPDGHIETDVVWLD
jgi:Icc protein